LACIGIADTPSAALPETKAKLEKALDYIVSCAKENGVIDASMGRRSYPVYSTSISLVCLAKFNRPKDLEIMKKARAYLLSPDVYPEGNPEHDPNAAGTGYGRNRRSDLSNTAWAMEALHVTEHLDKEPLNNDPQRAAAAKLAWDKALTFITHCQNLQETNQSAWVKSAPADDKGGFIYSPADAMRPANEAVPQRDDRPPQDRAQMLRSYGSMTYSGLKCLIYAKVNKDDVRMKSAFDWVKRYYTVDENPGVGDAGYYYYLHTFSKTLALFNQTVITDAKGVDHDWQAEMVAAVAKRQKPDGSWVNDNGRWMESLPALSTSYVLMALGNISR
jgi:squalene-hopene/tetraprenyl-beta-curcumene cyclase